MGRLGRDLIAAMSQAAQMQQERRMTTKVIIETNGGHAVLVTRQGSGLVPDQPPVMVPARSREEFHVFEGADLLIHEVKPGETQTVIA